MKRAAILFIPLVLMLMVSCNGRHDAQLTMALSLAEHGKPDSAISVLNKVNQTRLSDQDMAMYSLVYTLSQDKSGIDVNNDSLIGIAYKWYQDKPQDSLYAKCLYYMGKYYALNDSSEKALNCFSHSIDAAKKRKDYLTASMSFSQSSLILREYDPDKAIQYSKLAFTTYNRIKGGNLRNKIYSILNLAECYSYKKEKIDTCISLTRKAIKYAMTLRDSTVIANTLQDLSNFYDISGKDTMALKAAEESFTYRADRDASAILTLSNALYKAGNIDKAKHLLSQIKQDEYPNYGDVIYSLRRLIALQEGNCRSVSDFADSVESYLYKKNADNLSAKDKYYKLLVDRETKRASIQKENHWKTIVVYITLGLAIIIIFLVVNKAKKEKLMHLMEIKSKNLQITNIRSFLLKKVDIVKKLKAGDREDIIDGKKITVVLNNEDWEELETFLDNADGQFVTRIKKQFPFLTQKDIHFLMLIRLRLPVHRIAEIYHIKDSSVRQKLFLIKSKIGLKSGNDSTKEFIENY